jgi:hypothetical protein
MPAYFLTNTDSDIVNSFPTSFNYLQMSCLSYIPTTRVVTVVSGGLGFSFELGFITPIFYPNSTTAPSGNLTLEIIHTSTNMLVSVQASVSRVSSSGVFQTGTSLSASQTTAATNTFTLAHPSWTGASCSDRLSVSLLYTGTMNSQSVTLGLNRVGARLETNLDHNGTGCPVLRNPVSVSTNK